MPVTRRAQQSKKAAILSDSCVENERSKRLARRKTLTNKAPTNSTNTPNSTKGSNTPLKHLNIATRSCKEHLSSSDGADKHEPERPLSDDAKQVKISLKPVRLQEQVILAPIKNLSAADDSRRVQKSETVTTRVRSSRNLSIGDTSIVTKKTINQTKDKSLAESPGVIVQNYDNKVTASDEGDKTVRTRASSKKGHYHTRARHSANSRQQNSDTSCESTSGRSRAQESKLKLASDDAAIHKREQSAIKVPRLCTRQVYSHSVTGKCTSKRVPRHGKISKNRLLRKKESSSNEKKSPLVELRGTPSFVVDAHANQNEEDSTSERLRIQLSDVSVHQTDKLCENTDTGILSKVDSTTNTASPFREAVSVRPSASCSPPTAKNRRIEHNHHSSSGEDAPKTDTEDTTRGKRLRDGTHTDIAMKPGNFPAKNITYMKKSVKTSTFYSKDRPTTPRLKSWLETTGMNKSSSERSEDHNVQKHHDDTGSLGNTNHPMRDLNSKTPRDRITRSVLKHVNSSTPLVLTQKQNEVAEDLFGFENLLEPTATLLQGVSPIPQPPLPEELRKRKESRKKKAKILPEYVANSYIAEKMKKQKIELQTVTNDAECDDIDLFHIPPIESSSPAKIDVYDIEASPGRQPVPKTARIPVHKTSKTAKPFVPLDLKDALKWQEIMDHELVIEST